MTSVTIYLNGVSQIRWPYATADMFEPCVLTISSTREKDEQGNELVLMILEPDEWWHFDVLGDDGWPNFGYDNPALMPQQVPHHRLEGAA